MKIRKLFKTSADVLVTHKLFSFTILITLFLLLIRIPLGTFNDTSRIDTFGHFILPATVAPLIYIILTTNHFMPHLKTGAFLLFVTLLGTGMEVVWEIIEFGVDRVLPWHWQLSNDDTMMDLLLAVIGSFFGGLLFIAIYRRSPNKQP